jgi:hypothetical protein
MLPAGKCPACADASGPRFMSELSMSGEILGQYLQSDCQVRVAKFRVFKYLADTPFVHKYCAHFIITQLRRARTKPYSLKSTHHWDKLVVRIRMMFLVRSP